MQARRYKVTLDRIDHKSTWAYVNGIKLGNIFWFLKGGFAYQWKGKSYSGNSNGNDQKSAAKEILEMYLKDEYPSKTFKIVSQDGVFDADRNSYYFQVEEENSSSDSE